MGVVLRVARRLAAVAPAELERAAPAAAALMAGLARAYPHVALPPAVALGVPPVVVAAGEDGQQGQRPHALGRQGGVQARAQRPARAALGLGAAPVADDAAPGLGAGLQRLGRRVVQALPGAGLARGAVAAVLAHQAVGHRGRRGLAQQRPGLGEQAGMGGGVVVRQREPEVPALPDGDEQAVVVGVLVFVDMAAREQEVRLPEPARGLVAAAVGQGGLEQLAQGGGVHGLAGAQRGVFGQAVLAQCVRAGLGGVDGRCGWHGVRRVGVQRMVARRGAMRPSTAA